MKSSTAYANANIALVKYWGKQDRTGNIPAVPSLSMTLSSLGTKVTLTAAEQHTLLIGDQPGPAAAAQRTFDFLETIRSHHCFSGYLKISSTSTVPYASGLASSAAFYAALTTALNHYFAWNLGYTQLSILARLGSASAARSIFPGFVGLYGGNILHEQAHAFSIPCHADLELAMIIAIVNTKEKHISSRTAMNLTQDTSPLFRAFVNTQEADFSQALTALNQGSFEELGMIMEHSTLKMFATMFSARPAILYWQEPTIALMNLVYKIRQDFGPIAYFTMDAGPQVKILTKKNHSDLIMSFVKNSGVIEQVYSSCPGKGALVLDEHDTKNN